MHVPEVSLVVPTRRRRASVERLLDSLDRQTLAPSSFEVVVVISGDEDDGTFAAVSRRPARFRLRAIRQPRSGRAAACNAGIAAARGGVLVLLDDDMEAAPALLAAHLEAQRSGTSLGVVGAVPVVVEASSPPVVEYVAAKFQCHLAALGAPDYRFKLRDFYSGNFSIEREILHRVGGFDERFTLYGNEDLELSHRLVDAGVRLVFWAPALARQHYEKDFAGLAQDTMAKGRTAVMFARLHPEVYQHLKLSGFARGSRKRRCVRAILLALARVWRGAPEAIVAAVSGLERRRPRRLHSYYAIALDFFYWAGAAAANREASPAAPEDERSTACGR